MHHDFSKSFTGCSDAKFDPYGQQSLYDPQGRRKYVTDRERKAALQIALSRRPTVYTLCATLAYSGCRLSEALELDASRVDFEHGALIFRTLKKRNAQMFRLVPVPRDVLVDLDRVHGIHGRQKHQTDQSRQCKLHDPLWDWSRIHAWRLIKSVLCEAGVKGPAASPKGLRHGFGVTAVTKGLPLHLVQRWLGHTKLATTAIYADALGDEERQINTRMWL